MGISNEIKTWKNDNKIGDLKNTKKHQKNQKKNTLLQHQRAVTVLNSALPLGNQ